MQNIFFASSPRGRLIRKRGGGERDRERERQAKGASGDWKCMQTIGNNVSTCTHKYRRPSSLSLRFNKRSSQYTRTRYKHDELGKTTADQLSTIQSGEAGDRHSTASQPPWQYQDEALPTCFPETEGSMSAGVA